MFQKIFLNFLHESERILIKVAKPETKFLSSGTKNAMATLAFLNF